jgi:hypothetical protein
MAMLAMENPSITRVIDTSPFVTSILRRELK